MPPHKVAFFNHKGGVGKTILTFHVAVILARMGKRVLLVDADPQCNLSAYVIEESSLDKMLDNSEEKYGRTLWTSLRKIVNGTGSVEFIDPLELPTNRLSILPGDIRLFDYENALGDLWADCAKRRERGFVGVCALSKVVEHACKQGSFEYVLFDVGPNIGPLNKSIILDCDAIAVPAACDLFSSRAFKTLGAALSTWLTEWSAIASLAPPSFPRLGGSPMLLGYILQRFKLYGGVPTNAASRYMSILGARFPEVVSLVRNAPGGRVHPKAGDSPLGEIKDFGRLAPLSQHLGLPIFELEEAIAEERTAALDQFTSLTKRVRGRLGDKDEATP